MKKLLLSFALVCASISATAQKTPYAVYNNGTLTFWYDEYSSTRTGDVYTDLNPFVGDGGYLSVFIIPTPYAVFSNGILTFYCDNQSENRTGDVYTNILRKKATNQWGEHRAEIKKVVFNSSFAEARPTTTAHWFNGCKALTTMTGLNYLNTSEVTSMYAMFNGCSVIKSIDVSNFDTSNVKNMSYMFNSCPALISLDLKSFDTANVTNMSYMFNSCATIQTIEVGNGWNTENVTNSTRMFTECKKIMGSDASRYDENMTEKNRAHTREWGYLTGTKRAYCVYADGVLTFYYDNKWSKRTGDVYKYLIRAKSGDLWGVHKADVKKVVFTSDFANTHPGSLYHWFNGFKAIVGGTGTKYNANYIDKTRAHYGNGGYLTYKSPSVKEFNDTEFDTTAIDEIYTINKADVYTLQGIHIGNNIDPNTLPKGIYIANGKKIMVK